MQRNSTKNYEIFKQIGEGSYSKVYKAVRLADNTIVAIKVVNITKMDKIMINSTLNEIRILHSVNNDHVVGYYEAFLDSSENNLWIVMEFMGGGDLACAIKLAKKENRTFPERVIWIYFIQLLRGLVSLNQFKIIHRDIKPANIFLTTDQTNVKIGDMNVSKVVENELTRTQIGTPSYLAPEIWEGRAYDSRCDIYSLGCCIYEMAALRLPFEAKSMEELKQKIRNNVISPLPNQYSEELKKAIFKCLAKNPTVRPTAEKLLSSPIMQLKISEYGMEDYGEDEKGKLMDTILFPAKLSMLKNVLPKKTSQPKRSSSAANLKVMDSKNDAFGSLVAPKKESVPLVKPDPKASLNSSSGKLDSDKKQFVLPPKLIPAPQFQAVDAAKANMSKMNSKQEIYDIVDDRRPLPVPVPQPVEPKPMVVKQPPLPPTRSSGQKVCPVTPSVNQFDKIAQSSGKRSITGVSERDSIQYDSRQKVPVGKNLPPTPSTKLESIKSQASGQSSHRQLEPVQPGLYKSNNKNNSASAKKLEPITPEPKVAMKRQSSADRLAPSIRSNSNRNIPSPIKSEQQIPNANSKLPPRLPDKPLPPSANSFKKPPTKSMIPPPKQSTYDSNNRAGRYSTNPSNAPPDRNRGDSRDKVMKFDDFIKNFDESANRASKLRQQQPDAIGSARAPRYSSVRQKTRS